MAGLNLGTAGVINCSFFRKRGYRVVAPDMRGYGSTDAPAAVEAYDIKTLAADMVGIPRCPW